MSRRLAYLKEIGVPVYIRRSAPALEDLAQREEGAGARDERVAGQHERTDGPGEEAGRDGLAAVRRAVADRSEGGAARDDGLGLRHDAHTAPDGGLATPHDEHTAPGAGLAAPHDELAARAPLASRGTPISGEQGATAASIDEAWRVLAAEVAECRRCQLCESRTQTVFGVGRRDATLLVVGEAPGEEEDRQGQPFVGPAGRLLNAMLRAIGLSREQAYIANILKCRPPGNRDPRPDEAAACREYLDRQIALIQPQAMLAVGRVSAQRLLGSDEPVGKLRGVVHRYGEAAIPLVVTYHPAYLLRTPLAKAKSWQDLCMLLPMLQAEPEGQEAGGSR